MEAKLRNAQILFETIVDRVGTEDDYNYRQIICSSYDGGKTWSGFGALFGDRLLTDAEIARFGLGEEHDGGSGNDGAGAGDRA